jgi:ribonuclease-3
MTNPLPPLPNIRSAQTREQIFTHSSLTAKRRGEFEAPPDNPSRDNEEWVCRSTDFHQSIEFFFGRWAHIGDQVVSLVVTDLIQELHPRLRVGPTSVRRCIVLCVGFMFSPESEIARSHQARRYTRRHVVYPLLSAN